MKPSFRASVRFFLSLAFGLTFLAGCATYDDGVMIKESNLSVSDTRKAITRVIGEPVFMSQNGREMRSQYFDTKGRFDDFKSAKSRLFTEVVILGERRPYDIQIVVKVQVRRPDGSYEVVAQDDRRAKDQADKIKKAMNESRDNRNFIDDFKPY